MSRNEIIARVYPDGTVRRVLPDGTEVDMPPLPPLAPVKDADIHAAALSDPDAQPITDAEFARMRAVPPTKTLRRALGLTLEEFAARYRIPIGTLRDWEQGRREPDQLARAYLKVIAFDPEGVHRALQRGLA
jgi:putative transcriptional regulator